jgi:hypothetical protein
MPGPNSPSPDLSTPAGPSDPDFLRNAALQADTFVRNAANVASFGLADKGEAALQATLGVGGTGDWASRYNKDLKQQAARNVYDQVYRAATSRLGQAAGVGLTLADGNILGAEGASALPIKVKGLLGEGLSTVKTLAKGDLPSGFQVPFKLDNGLKTIIDHQTMKGMSVEAKFGPWARLSKNQRYAQKQLGDAYRVDLWGPRHIGYITGGMGAGAGLLSAGLQSAQPNAANQPLGDY